MGEEDRFYWGQAGGFCYCLVDRQRGRIVALLYWESEMLGTEGGPEGEPVICEPAWLLLGADEPDQHYELKAPSPTMDLTDAELAAAHDAALEEGQRAILEHLDMKGLL